MLLHGSEHISQHEQSVFCLIVQASLRFGDVSSLSSLKIVGLGVVPGAVASLPPGTPHTSHRWVLRVGEATRDPLALAWLACALGRGQCDRAPLGLPSAAACASMCLPALEARMADAANNSKSFGDAEACLRLGLLFSGREPLKTARAIDEVNAGTGKQGQQQPQLRGEGGPSAQLATAAAVPPHAPPAQASFLLGPHLRARGRSKKALARDDAFRAEECFSRAALLGSGEAAFKLSISLWGRSGAKNKNRGGGGGASRKKRGSSGGGGSGGGGGGNDQQQPFEDLRQRSLRWLEKAASAGWPAALVMLSEARARGDISTSTQQHSDNVPLASSCEALASTTFRSSEQRGGGGSGCEHGSGGGLGADDAGSGGGNCHAAGVVPTARDELEPQGRASLSVHELESRHVLNSGKPLEDIAACGRYLNLLKSDLGPVDVPNVFALLRKAQQQRQDGGLSSGDNNGKRRRSRILKGPLELTTKKRCEGNKRQVCRAEKGVEGKEGGEEDYAGGGGSDGCRSEGKEEEEEEDCFSGVSSCERLGLSHNRGFGARGAEAVAVELLRLLPTDNGNNEATADSSASTDALGAPAPAPIFAFAFAVAPAQGHSLRDLFFSDCGLGPSGGLALARALTAGACPALQKLGLNYNGLGDDGATAILKAIIAFDGGGGGSASVGGGVLVLGLIGNGVGDAGALAAASVLACSRCPLTRLYLNENAVGDRGATALAAAVRSNSANNDADADWQRQSTVEPIGAGTGGGAGSEAGGSFAGGGGSGAADAGGGGCSDVGGGGGGEPFEQRRRSRGRRSLERLGLLDNAIGKVGGLAWLRCLSSGSTALEKLCASDNPFGDEVFDRLSSLPNVFVGAKPRRGRSSQLLNGSSCRVMVVYQPPAAPSIMH